MAKGEEHEEESVEKPEGGKKKLIIIGTAILVALACIAGGVAFYLNSTAGEAADQPGGKKAESSSKKHEATALYPVEPFVVNIRDNTDVRYLKVKLEFEVIAAGPEVKAEFDPYLPKLRDSILMLLTSKTLADVQDLPGKTRLRQEIMTSAVRIFPRGKVTQVFFTDFVVQ